MTETWRYCVSAPQFIVSSEGRIMILPHIGVMPNGSERHYETTPLMGVVSLKNANRPTIVYRRKSYRISLLVCEAFHGAKPFASAVVMHIDDDPKNNRASNLRWGTQKENLNTQKFIEYCKLRKAENSPVAKGKLKRIERLSTMMDT